MHLKAGEELFCSSIIFSGWQEYRYSLLLVSCQSLRKMMPPAPTHPHPHSHPYPHPLPLLTAAVPTPGLAWLARNPVKLPVLFLFLFLQSWLWPGSWDRVCGLLQELIWKRMWCSGPSRVQQLVLIGCTQGSTQMCSRWPSWLRTCGNSKLPMGMDGRAGDGGGWWRCDGIRPTARAQPPYLC